MPDWITPAGQRSGLVEAVTRTPYGKIQSAGYHSLAHPAVKWGLTQLRLIVAVFIQRSLLAVLCIALSSCQWLRTNSAPSIEFTHIRSAAQGGPERVDTISGRVRNARPNQKIVIYAHSGQWWVQPWPDRLIPINADSTWSTETHLGFEYAALLVDSDYHPLPTTDVAPTQGGPVAPMSIVKGTGTPQLDPTGSLKFSGYDWGVRMVASDKGGANNFYDSENAWTDASGALHSTAASPNCANR